MTNKDQLIKEMASDIDYATVKHDLWPDDTKEIAKTLIMLGYRKIPEDSVVLEKEEYEEYKKVADGKAIMVENITDLNRLAQFPIEYDGKMFEAIDDFGNYIDEQARKETAKQILNKQYQECKVAERDVLIARGNNKNDDYYKGFSLGMTNAKMHIEELATRFEVEMKE